MPKIAQRDRLKLPHIEPIKRPPQERLADFCEVNVLYTPDQALAEASRCVECKHAPCAVACPLGNHIRDWLVLAAEGRFLDAAHLAATTSNMPEICGRICPQDRLCEEACIVGVKQAPVAIGAIEKFITEYAIAQEGLPSRAVAPSTGHRIAVVGSGPAGLACAEELAIRGHHVTVYEASAEPGGLLRYGIPEFKLEKTVVDRRIQYLERLGIEFICGTRIGQDIRLAELSEAGFHAIFLAPGATTPKRPKIPGIELSGVEDALPFVVRNNVADSAAGRDDMRGKRIVVLGGGDTAMDCVRTARRLGAKTVSCVYRRDEANMPGSRREVRSAKEEGVEFQWLTAPARFLDDGSGRVKRVECLRMQLGDPDAERRRRPVLIEGSNFEIEVDLVILAFGFDGSPVPAIGGPQVTDAGTYVVDKSGLTTKPPIFAGGDAVRGPDLLVTALRDGRRTAEAIDQFLQAEVA